MWASIDRDEIAISTRRRRDEPDRLAERRGERDETTMSGDVQARRQALDDGLALEHLVKGDGRPIDPHTGSSDQDVRET